MRPDQSANHLEATVSERPIWQTIRRYLEARKTPVDAEIRAYPSPIAGCDAQFNYLLEERAKLSRALVRLDALARETAGNVTPAEAVEAFLQDTDALDGEAERGLWTALAEEFPDLRARTETPH